MARLVGDARQRREPGRAAAREDDDPRAEHAQHVASRAASSSAVSMSVRTPARRRHSSSACACSESMSQAQLASKIRTASGRIGAGATPLAAASQPVAQRKAKPSSAERDSPSRAQPVHRGQQHLLDGPLDRAHRKALLRIRSDSSSSKRRSAERRRTGEDGPLPRSRAIEIADETLCVSSKAWRSASISVRSNWRWPPGSGAASGIRICAPTTATYWG